MLETVINRSSEIYNINSSLTIASFATKELPNIGKFSIWTFSLS